MVDQGVPTMLHNRVVNYFNYLWMRNKGKNQHLLLNDCPTCLRAEVYLSITRPMLETVRLSFCISLVMVFISWFWICYLSFAGRYCSQGKHYKQIFNFKWHITQLETLL